VKVSVYYESLCPDSIRFLTNQFTPVYNQLGSSNIEVDFLPYGKATVSCSLERQIPNFCLMQITSKDIRRINFE